MKWGIPRMTAARGAVLFPFLLIIMALLLPLTGFAQEGEDWVEIQVDLDFDLGHSVLLYLPEGIPAEAYVEASRRLAGEGAHVEYTYTFSDGEQCFSLQAPNLIPHPGTRKTLHLDVTEIKELALESGLDTSIYLYLAKPLYLLDFVMVVEGEPMVSPGEDWGIWWEAPPGTFSFRVDIMLLPDFSTSALSPGFVLIVWALYMAYSLKKKRVLRPAGWKGLLVHGLFALAFAFCLEFFGWAALGRYLFPIIPFGPAPMVSTVVVFYLIFLAAASYATARNQNPGYRLKDSFPRYSLSLLYLLYIALLLLAGLVLWPPLQAMAPWLGVGVMLSAAPFLYGNGLIMIFYLLGARTTQDPGIISVVESIEGKMGFRVGRKLLVPEKKCRTALAAFITQPPSILVTEYLWKNTTRDEQEFIVAHELAHVKVGYGPHLWAVRICAWMVALSIMLPAWLPIHPNPSLAAGLISVWLLQYFVFFPRLRGKELHADSLALSFTGNPAAAISALDKLEKLNSHMNVNQRTTHPTMGERIEALQQEAAGEDKVGFVPGL